jgi:hypothetical protein
MYSQVPTSQYYHYSLPFLQNYYKIFILLSFFFPPTKTNHFFPPQKTWTSIQDWIENYVWGKKEPPMIRVRFLKRRRKEVKIDPKFGGQWNVPSLVANGRWRKNTFSPLPTFPPTKLTQTFIFFLWSYGFA